MSSRPPNQTGIDSNRVGSLPPSPFVDLLTSFLHGRPYHMQHSGYEALVDFMPNARVINSLDFKNLPRLSYPLRLAHIIPRSYASLDAERAALRSDGRVLHHLYAEDTMWASLFAKRQRRSRPIVATFHRPPNLLERDMPFFWKRKMRNLSGVIALSPNQRDYISSVCGTKTLVTMIPHGIDTDRYAPADELESKDLLLSVGGYLRDATTLLHAMRILADRGSPLKLVVVSKQPIVDGRNVSSFTNIGDEDLLNYYKRAAIVVLPFHTLVASNAMLEAMAFGKPIVCPDSDSARFYLGHDVQTMYNPGKPDSLVEKILWLHNNTEERRRLGSEMRARALQFSWPKICKSILAFYDEVGTTL